MSNVRLALSVLCCFGILTACSQNKDVPENAETPVEEIETNNEEENKAHPYGGWYCPDNLRGFPPVDINELSLVPVVSDRLPTEEETRNGTSLMYFDTTKIQGARPLDIRLPTLAKVYSSHSDIDELVIVIQAIVVGEDSVVGYRFPNGGNGSAWYNQVTFLSEEEMEELGPNPFVFIDVELDANKKEIWEAISKTDYARKIAEKFDKKEFFESEWTDDSKAHLNYDSDNERAAGIVFNFWGNLYLHADYEIDDFHYSEKILVMAGSGMDNSRLQLVAGPFPVDFEKEQANWNNWLAEVKEYSEGTKE